MTILTSIRLLVVVTVFVGLLALGMVAIRYVFKRRLREKMEGLESARLKISEQANFLDLVTDAVQAGIWDLSVPENEGVISRKWFEMLGYERNTERMSLDKFREFVHPDDRLHMEETHRKYVENSGTGLIENEIRLLQASGDYCWVLVKGKAVQWDEGGTPARIIGLTVNIQSIKDTQERMQQSEERFRQLFTSAPVPLVLLSPDGTLLALNDAMIHTFGYTPEDIPDLDHWWQLAYRDPEYRRRAKSTWESDVRRALSDNVPVKVHEYRVTCKNGMILRVRFDTNVFGDMVIVSLYEITALREKEAVLQETMEQLRATLDATTDGIMVVDKNLKVIQANRQFYDMWRIPHDLPNIDDEGALRAFVKGQLEDPDGFVNLLEKLYASRRHDMFEIRFKDGRVIECYSASMVVAGEETGRVWDVRDITVRKQAEAQLRQSEEKFSKIFAMAPLIVAITRFEDATIIDVNDGFEEITGWRKSEVIGRTAADIRIWAEPTRREDHIKELKAGRNLMNREVYFRCKDGSVRSGLYSARSIRLSGELSILSVIQDITEIKKMEADRQKLQEQLSQAQKMEAIGTLAGGVAHDFNNILGAIIGYTELALERVDASNPLRETFDIIHDAALRSANLTRQLLAFARKEVIEPVFFDINTAVKELLKMLQRLIGENIELRWQPGPGPLTVRLDPSQLDQILANLCVNARDAIGDIGGVTIQTESKVFDEAACAFHPECAPGDYVVLSVSDDGCGMEPDTLNRIFEPFFTTKGQGKGTGLGLSTVYGIVRQNNGFISAYSETGKGTTFNVYIPRKAGDVGEKSSSVKEIPGSGGETILLVEDDPVLLSMSETMLRRLGYEVLGAAAPTRALGQAREHPGQIHMFFTDVVMPEMSGRELAGELEKIRPGIRHLFMSGYTADVIAHQGVLDEGVNFIHKPFSLQSLSDKIRSVLDR